MTAEAKPGICPQCDRYLDVCCPAHGPIADFEEHLAGYQLAPPGSHVYGPDDERELIGRFAEALSTHDSLEEWEIVRILARLVCGGDE